MPPKDSRKARVRDLERVRLNQQRSRARRKEYIAELEGKVAQLEYRLHQEERATDTEHTIAQLRTQNRIMSETLSVLGIGLEYQQRLLNSASKAEALRSFLTNSEAPLAMEKNAPYGLEVSDETPSGKSESSLADTSIHSTRTRMRELRPRHPAENNGQSTTTSSTETCCTCPSSLPSSMNIDQINETTITNEAKETSTPDRLPSTESTLRTSDFTTACSVAYRILNSNNARGYSMADLEKRMRVGYLSGNSPGADCRIRNKVFFNVLAEIVQ